MFGHLREKFREVAKHPKGMLAAGNIVREPGPVDEKVATALATYDAAVVSSVAVDKGCHAAWAEVAAASEAFVDAAGLLRLLALTDDLARPGAAPTDDLGAAVLRLRRAEKAYREACAEKRYYDGRIMELDGAAPADKKQRRREKHLRAVEGLDAAERALAAALGAARARGRRRRREAPGLGRARRRPRDAAAGTCVETWAALKDAAPRVVERVGDAQRALRRLADAGAAPAASLPSRRPSRRRTTRRTSGSGRAPRPRGRPSPRPAPSASRRARAAADALDGAGLGDLLSSDRAAALDAGLEQRVSLAVEVGHYDGKTASLEGAADGDRVARNAEKRETAARLLEEHDHRLDEAFCAYDEVRVAVNARAAAALLGALDALGRRKWRRGAGLLFLGRVAALSGGADAPDVRIAEYDLAASDAGTAARHAGRLRRLAACAAVPNSNLQLDFNAGVVVALNTPARGDWVDAYVDMWLPHLGKRDGDLRAVARVGSDQEPLWAIVKRRCLEAATGTGRRGAPPEFNARFLRPGRAAALDDDVLIVHDNAVGHYGGRGRHFDLRRWDVAALLGRVARSGGRLGAPARGVGAAELELARRAEAQHVDRAAVDEARHRVLVRGDADGAAAAQLTASEFASGRASGGLAAGAPRAAAARAASSAGGAGSTRAQAS
ncbi:hypothetical protein JL720_1957 [Aureococcus anophagefferens]|nr:hypothetical protein JL720_1957 [Aureococcus anophagefferens]